MSNKLLLLTAVLMSISTNQASAETDLLDGVYELDKGAKSVRVKRSDGSEVQLGKRLCGVSTDATLVSRSNDNSLFSLNVMGCGPIKNPRQSQKAFVIDGVCEIIGGTSVNADDSSKLDLQARIFDEENAKRIANRLKIKPKPRKHPGHKMLVKWASVEPVWKVGDDIELELQIKNVGDVPFIFMEGGQQRGPRDNQFKFVAFSGSGFGKAIPDVGDPQNFGGIGAFRTIKPGETFTKRIGLSKWFKFEKPDTLEVFAIYELELLSDDINARPIWKDFATGKCSVRIE